MGRLNAALLLALLATAWGSQDKNAGDKSQSSPSKPAGPAKLSISDPGAISEGVYRNSSLGFSYKMPYGWVDRTADMQDDSADAGKSRLLLAVFERPPEATGDTINSAVVIAAEPLSTYPGMKTAAEYLESLSALTTAKDFKPEQDPQEFSVGGTKLVRGDFSKARGKLTMYQTSLALLAKGNAISFTFIAGTADEINELIEGLSFAGKKTSR